MKPYKHFSKIHLLLYSMDFGLKIEDMIMVMVSFAHVVLHIDFPIFWLMVVWFCPLPLKRFFESSRIVVISHICQIGRKGSKLA